MKKLSEGLLLFFFIFLFTNCTPIAVYDAPESLDEDIRLLIVSEGQFGYGTSSLTSLSYNGNVEQDIFRRVNNRPMGDVAQSVMRIGDLLYVPMNNSRKIEVMNAKTFESVETMPVDRDVIPMYATHLGGDSIALTDQKPNSQLMIMDINHGTDRQMVRRSFYLGGRSSQMAIVNNKLFVNGDNMSVYDLNNITSEGRRLLIKNDGVSIQNADFSKIVVDKYDRIWVLGYWQVLCIDPVTEKTIHELNVIPLNINTRRSAIDISQDLSTIYFNSARRVYSIDVDDPQIPTEPLFRITRDDQRTVYNMAVSKENTIFFSEVLYGSLSRSRIYEYDLEGNELLSFRAGIFSHALYFY